jgi:hypothetical protein
MDLQPLHNDAAMFHLRRCNLVAAMLAHRTQWFGV